MPQSHASDPDRHCFLYEACDIPEGMTIGEFRALRSAIDGPHRRSFVARLRGWAKVAQSA
jgi:hypothetical protein